MTAAMPIHIVQGERRSATGGVVRKSGFGLLKSFVMGVLLYALNGELRQKVPLYR
jgi:high-affinity Fe2+/Pb2+ permease